MTTTNHPQENTARGRATDPDGGTAPYRAGEQVFAVYATARGTEAGYGHVMACVPRPGEAPDGAAGWTLIAEVGDLVLTYPLGPDGSSTRVHRPIRRHPVHRVLPTLLHHPDVTDPGRTGGPSRGLRGTR